jgi:hypothetical protein
MASCAFASAQGYHYNKGYTTGSGTYVPGHYQTNSNGSRYDNWSTQGNSNPFTGQPGYKSPYSGGSTTSPSYGSSGYRPRYSYGR